MTVTLWHSLIVLRAAPEPLEKGDLMRTTWS